jgi:hypothetical protein
MNAQFAPILSPEGTFDLSLSSPIHDKRHLEEVSKRLMTAIEAYVNEQGDAGTPVAQSDVLIALNLVLQSGTEVYIERAKREMIVADPEAAKPFLALLDILKRSK